MTYAPIDAQSVSMARIVSKPANVSTVDTAIISPANVNVLPDLWGTIVWTVAPVIHLVLIVRKRVVAKMVPLVIRQRVHAHVHRVGKEQTAIVDGVPIITTAKCAIKHANVKRTIRKYAIHGQVNVIVEPAGVVRCAIDLVHS